MKNQQTHRLDTSAGQTKKGNGVKHLPTAGLVLGIIATAFVIIWLTMFDDASSSRSSTVSEVTAQKEFQERLNKTQEELQQKVETATKEAEQKSDSVLKEAEQKSDKYLYGK